MMRRGGIVLGLSLILVFSIFFIGIENLKGALPNPKIEELKDWDFGPNKPTDTEIYIYANMNVSNMKGDALINVLQKGIIGHLYYIDLSNNEKIALGDISFINFKNIGMVSEKEIVNKINAKTEKDIPFYIKIYSNNLFEALYRHININKEECKFEIDIDFESQSELKFLGLVINDFINKTILTFKSELIKTNFLKLFEEFKYNYYIPESFINLSKKPILDKFMNISYFKDVNSSIIMINRIIFNKFTKNVIDIYLGERLAWDYPTVKYISNISTINLTQKIIVYGNSIYLKQFKKMFPKRLDIIANNITVGNIEINKISEENYVLFYKKLIYEAKIGIVHKNMGTWLKTHILNGGHTMYYFKNNNLKSKPQPFDFNLSEMEPVSIDKYVIDWEDFKGFLSYIQYTLVIGITIISVYLIISFYFKRKIRK